MAQALGGRYKVVMHDPGPDMDVSDTTLLGGRVALWQPRHGYRAGLDAVFLAASVRAGAQDHVLEIGCGVGAALICAAHLNPEARFTGVEVDAAAAALAERNIARNAMTGRVRVVCADMRDRVVRDGGPYSWVISNPPYFDDARAQRAPAGGKRQAFLTAIALADWLDVMQRRLPSGGRLALIHRAERLPDILTALQPRCGGLQVLPLHPFAGHPAKRVLVAGRKSARAPFLHLSGMVLHEASQSYTAGAGRVLRGEEKLPFME